ncbi:hypothetical protein JOC58_004783 [Paenibacillus hunanensis]|uniref:Uncharacterized protein n=1 Tax=Paenibacillus hunanensis TaxID=539262 RepID=A0ABU1J5N9_9BACL|nr:hypothetical protein [Paenibacillus hunanensis]
MLLLSSLLGRSQYELAVEGSLSGNSSFANSCSCAC